MRCRSRRRGDDDANIGASFGAAPVIRVPAALAILCGAAALTLAGAAPARTVTGPQETDAVTPPGGQVRYPAAEDRLPAVDQVSRTADRASGPAQVAPRRPALPGAAQIEGVRREPIPASGSSAATRDVRSTPQLSRGPATAAAPEALSSPAQGRRQSLERLAGRDRCDPQTNQAIAETCARVIETRSGEFARADPLILSPEQRLLIDQRLREGTTSSQTAIQRIGKNDVDADSMDAQSIASLTLQQRSEPTVQTAPTTDAEAAASSLVQAIIEGARSLNPPK